MTQPTPELQFDHATYDQPKTGVTCGMCKKPVGREYWQWMGRVVCASCREQVRGLEAAANTRATFATAVGAGVATSLACGVAYGVFSYRWPNVEWAIVTIGIGYAIAAVIRKATKNVGGRRYQVLAAVLTYAAATPQYAHNLVPRAAVALWLAHPGAMLPWLLISPVIFTYHGLVNAQMNALFGPVIIGIGVWEAWRRSRGLPMVVTGPFRVAPAAQVPAP
jgi:hypothetical protein